MLVPAEEHVPLFLAVLDEVVVDVADAALLVDHPDRVVGGEDGLDGALLDGELLGSEFEVHSGVVDLAGISEEDETVFRDLELDDLLSLEILVDDFGESVELVVLDHSGIGACSEHSSVVGAGDVDSAVVEQEERVAACGLDFLDVGVVGVQEVVDLRQLARD